MVQALKSKAKGMTKHSLYRIFQAAQRFGIDVLPRHFYSEIPDIRQLRQDRKWREPYSMIGVDGAEITSQLEFIASCCTPQLVERQRHGAIWERACERNGEPGFGMIEADFLHCFIRSKRPQRIV